MRVTVKVIDLDIWLHKLWTYHKVGVRLNPTSPHPGVLLADSSQPHTIFCVQGRLFIRAAHHYVLALGEVADAAWVIGESPVFPNLRETKKGEDIKNRNKTSISCIYCPRAQASTPHCLGPAHFKVLSTFNQFL